MSSFWRLLKQKRSQTSDEVGQTLDAIGIGWFRSTESGRIIAANRMLQQILGVPSLEHLLQLNASDLHADPGARDIWRNELATQGTVTGFKCRLRYGDQPAVWVRQNAHVVTSSRGEGIFEGTVENVSREHALEEQLAASEERHRLIASSANVGIISIGPDSAMLFANPAVERIFGYDHHELIGRKLTMLMPERLREAHDTGMRRYLQSGERRLAWDCIRLPGLHKSGEEIPLELAFSEHSDHSTRVFTGVIHDISAQVRAEAERSALEHELFHARKMEAVGRLAGGIAHDFNNLLTTIMGQAELALGDDSLSPELRADIEEIKRSGKRAAEMTRQLLAFSRKQVLQPRIFDLREVVQNADRMMRRLIGEIYDLQISLSPQPAGIYADPAQLDQVLMNLVINARDAMPDGGVIEIRVLSDPAAQTVEMIVRDQGIGIAPELLGSIFEPFFTTKPPGQGTGLGLSTVEGIVRQSGGHVRVESRPGAGSSFHVFFPAAQGDSQTVAPREATRAQPLRSGSVLLVEDEESVRSFASKILQRCGYTVIQAAHAEAALDISNDILATVDLLLTDVVMPGLRGDQLADRLLARYPRMKVLFMSGYAEEAIRKHGRIIPGSLFIQKPFDGQLLMDSIARLTGESTTEQQSLL